MSDLLEPDFIRKLEVLRRHIALEARSRKAGERRGRARGGSAEFAEHRPYAPGDDLARLDWMAFARNRDPVTKVFHIEEDVIVRLCLDGSASVATGTKMEKAQRIAAAVGYLALANAERAQVMVLGGSESAPRAFPTHRGRRGVGTLLRELATIRPAGSLNLVATLDAAVTRMRPAGALVVISDFFDPGPLDRALGRLRAAGHDLHLVQVLAPEEITPTIEGDLTLVDAESGAELPVTVDGAALAAYDERLQDLFRQLARAAKRHAGSYVRVRTDEPLEGAVRRFVERAIDGPETDRGGRFAEGG